ncbi:unnamed protein product [Pieris brassicae]|uniref:Death domain-associated protein 6 n=1 Tax=Pieris brassicae TaxID=7116 RepID=A0A9P0TGM8_PIEBR|nr:unnamed protein product [Pieris brassicae]
MCSLENACDIINLSSDEAGDVEIVDWRSPISLNKDENSNFEFIDDVYLKDLIQICLKAENSKGMLRVINRSLLPLYQEAKPDYLNSIEFQEVLQRSSVMIEQKPTFKFSYIKSVCENLRKNKKRKRLSFITLDSNVKRNKVNNGHNMENGKIHVIDEDSIGESGDKNDLILLEETVNEEKENKSKSLALQLEHLATIFDSDLTALDTVENVNDTVENVNDIVDNGNDPKEIQSGVLNLSYNSTCDKATTSNKLLNNSQENLLITHRIELLPTDDEQVKIKSIEFEITRLEKIIKQLEETEVIQDNYCSPYVLCEEYKEKVVDLYKQLCHLTQSPLVKKHEVRLRVLEGHVEAPVKILERFLNNNLQSNGYPLFPDFNDVKICVVLANDIYKLGWDARKVMKEARALFTQCGRALQKLRQGREWRDLLANVKKEHEDDPALHDPDLMAKLDANKQWAIKSEMDIIEKYAQMETEALKKRKKHTEIVNKDDATSDSDADSVVLCEEDMLRNEEFFRKLREEVKIEQTDNVDDTHNDEQVNVKECVVKMEPLSKQLEDLGDNFTVTIEIDNPFLVVEVSSDSDDDVEL